MERLSTIHAEWWSGLEKTKKKRRKRKKQTCSLAMLQVAMDGVAVADCGADWLVVLLSFFLYVSLMLFISSVMFFLLFPVLFFLSLSSPLKRPLVQNSTIILCFFSRSLCFSNILSPVFSFSAPPLFASIFYFLFHLCFISKLSFSLEIPLFCFFFLVFTFSVSRTILSFLLHSSPLFICPSHVFIGGQGRKPPLPSPIAPNE